jgi:hypothetical protein
MRNGGKLEMVQHDESACATGLYYGQQRRESRSIEKILICERGMELISEILQAATARIAPEYFLLPTHGAPPVYRERVYCYELYHQMRLLWPQDCPYRLNGEVDKRAHPYFGDDGEPKPDLLVHEPGTGNNHAVIEVKSSRASHAGIQKDLESLTRFRTEIGYMRAIYLVYGHNACRTVAIAQRYAAERQAPIELWRHPTAGNPAARV